MSNRDLVQIAAWRARLAALIDACDMVPTPPVHDAVDARFDAGGMLTELHIDPDGLKDYENTELQQIIADVLRITRARVYRLVQAHAIDLFCGWAGSDRNSPGTEDAFIDANETLIDDAGALWCQLEASANHVFAWLSATGGDNAGTGSADGAAADVGEIHTYAESSRDGVLALALDNTGAVLWCRLQTEVNQWGAHVLAVRIMRLYTLALMRARCQERSRIENRFGPELAAEIFSQAPAAYPDKQTVKRYRQRCIDF